MKYIFGIIISLVVLAGFLLVWNGNLIKEGSNMSNDVVDMVRSDEDIILIDVRTPQEYRERRIPGSILLPDYEIRDRAADVIPDRMPGSWSIAEAAEEAQSACSQGYGL